MNFRLAYKPRARLQPVNPCGHKEWSEKTGWAFKLKPENSASPVRGEIFVKTIPMNFQAPSGATSCLAAKNMPLLTELFSLAMAILQIYRATGAGEKLQRTGALQDASRLPSPSMFAPAFWTAVALHRFDFTATIFRGAADGRGSSAPRPRRWCLQTETSASAIRRGRRKKPRWLCLGGGH